MVVITDFSIFKYKYSILEINILLMNHEKKVEL